MDDARDSFDTREEILQYLEEDCSDANLNHRRADLFRQAAYMAASEGDLESTRGHWAEFMVFSLHAAEPDNGGGEYLRPMITIGSWGWPDPNSIPDVMLDYLEDRSKRTGTPYLRARYADFLWQRGRGHAYARDAALSHLELVRREAEQERYHSAADSACRSLSLAFALNDRRLKAQVVEDVTTQAEQWTKPAVGAGYFVTAMIDKILSHSRLRDRTLLGRWEKLLQAGLGATLDHHIRRELLAKLAMVLGRLGKIEDARQRLVQIGQEWEAEARERESDSLVAAEFYKEALEAYVRAGASRRVEELKTKTRELYKRAEKELKPLSWEVKIDTKPWIQQVSKWLDQGCREALVRLAAYLPLVPSWRAAEKQSNELKHKAPLTHLIPRTILDDGRPISDGQSEEERHLQSVRHQYSFMMIGTMAQLSSAIRLMREQQVLVPDCLVDAIGDSPFFDTPKIEIIRRGFERYVEQDYVSTLHVLVPQIEDALRRFLGKLGGNTLSYREGRLREKNLEQVLATKEMKATLERLSADVWQYFNHVLVAETGMNLRNKIAHGLVGADDINENVANCVLHLYLLLGLFRLKDNEAE